MATGIDWSTYSDEELTEASNEIEAERNRRYSLTSIPQQINALNAGYLDASGTVTGEAWVQPTIAAEAYPIDWIVNHGGKTWRSTVMSNVWEPGVSGWHEEVTPGNEWPDWVQPTGAHDAYPLDAQVSHASKHWKSAIADNVWEPGSPGAEALWTEQP